MENTFAGGSAYFAGLGAKNPLVAAIAMAMITQDGGMQVAKASDAGVQSVGTSTGRGPVQR